MLEFNLQYLKFYIKLITAYLDNISIINLILLNTKVFSNLAQFYLNKVNIENKDNLKGPNKVINEKDYRLALEVYKHICNNMNSICIARFCNNDLIYAKKLALQMRNILSETHIFLYMKGQILTIETKWIRPNIPSSVRVNGLVLATRDLTPNQLATTQYCKNTYTWGSEELKIYKIYKAYWSIMIAVPFTSILFKYFNTKLKKDTKVLNTSIWHILDIDDLYKVFKKIRNLDNLKKNNLIDMQLIKVKPEFVR